MDNIFTESGGGSGSWWDGLGKLTDRVLAYKQATAPDAVRWAPYGAGDAVQYGVGANGEIITRGLPASSVAPFAGVASLMPLLLLAGIAFIAFRALK